MNTGMIRFKLLVVPVPLQQSTQQQCVHWLVRRGKVEVAARAKSELGTGTVVLGVVLAVDVCANNATPAKVRHEVICNRLLCFWKGSPRSLQSPIYVSVFLGGRTAQRQT